MKPEDDSLVVETATTATDRLPTNIYSIFLPWQKNCIIGLAALAGWFSSLSSFIYFPAIPFLATDLQVSVQQVNLTVTSYLIMSGIFPSIMGDAADRFGRRPVFLVALIVYLGANIGLALQSQFALLFFLRMLQSAGISGTFSIAYGVLGDLFVPAERGGYSGIISFFLNTPPSLGPVFSGLLLLQWSWRSVFWFLAAASTLCILVMIVLLPETARKVVGDGSIAARGIDKAPIPLLAPKIAHGATAIHSRAEREDRWNLPNPLASLKLLRFPDTAIILVVYGINYTVYCCVQSSLSTLFLEIYHVSGLVAGLIYLPFGVGCALTAFATGKLLDIDYRKTAAESGIVIRKGESTSMRNFPIERARLRDAKYSAALSALLVMGYGWLLQQRQSMAAPLVMQFFIGLTIQMVFTAANTLLVDIHPDCPSTAQAACNLIRCEMAAACLAGLDPLLRRLGPGWSFVIFGAALLLVVPMLIVLQLHGMKWRQRRSAT